MENALGEIHVYTNMYEYTYVYVNILYILNCFSYRGISWYPIMYLNNDQFVNHLYVHSDGSVFIQS